MPLSVSLNFTVTSMVANDVTVKFKLALSGMAPL